MFLLAGQREKGNRTEWKITKIIRSSWGPLTVNSLSGCIKMHSFLREALAPLSTPNLSTLHTIETTSAPRPDHQTAAQELQPLLCFRERWRRGISSEGLLSADPYWSRSGVLPSRGTRSGSSPAQGCTRLGSCTGWACTGSRGFLLLQQTQAEEQAQASLQCYQLGPTSIRNAAKNDIKG